MQGDVLNIDCMGKCCQAILQGDFTSALLVPIFGEQYWDTSHSILALGGVFPPQMGITRSLDPCFQGNR